jgi:hypothetical protein
MCKFKIGCSGMPAAIFRFPSTRDPYPDRESHAKPYGTCNLALCGIQKKDTVPAEQHK